jgi:hypothetical protein
MVNPIDERTMDSTADGGTHQSNHVKKEVVYSNHATGPIINESGEIDPDMILYEGRQIDGGHLNV